MLSLSPVTFNGNLLPTYMNKFFLFFFGICFLSSSLAQQDTLKLKSYQELSDILNFHMTSDTTLALKASRVYLEKARKDKNLEEEWRGIHAIAIINYTATNYTVATSSLEELISFTEAHELEEFYSRTYQTAGAIFTKEGTLSKALHYYNKALEVAEEQKDLRNIQVSYYLISMLQSIGGNYSEAIGAQHKMILRLEAAGEDELPEATRGEMIFLAKASIADSYIKAKNADSAYFYSNKVLKEALENNRDSCSIKGLYWQLGMSELLIEDYDAAKKSIDYSTKYCRPFSKFDSLIVGGLYGKIYSGKKQYKKAIQYLENAFKTYNVSEAEEGFMDDYYKVLANAYKEEGDLEKSSFYFEKYVNTTTKFSKIKDTLNTSFRNKEIEAFEAELESLKAEKEQQKGYLQYLFLGASIIILGLLFLLLKFYRNKKANEAKFEALLTKIETAEQSKDIIDTKDEVLEEKNTSDVPEDVKEQILNGLIKLEEKEYFLKQECNSYNVAKKINTNTSYLSKVINSHFGKNFNTYINDLRINYAIVRLKNDVIFRSYSIQSIAEELGYKSADSFTKYFKKDTGLNPSFYIKEIKNIA